MDVRDVGVIQRGQKLRLTLEPREAIGIAGKESREDLDRDVAIQLLVAGTIHLSHSAFAKFGENVIWPDRASNAERHFSLVAVNYTRLLINCSFHLNGEMAEWLKAHAWK